jgi:hypothetical protein
MAISKRNPNTILLHGGTIHDADHQDGISTHQAGVAITPGMLVEMYTNGTELNWRPHASADEQVSTFVALDRSENNLTIDTAIAIGDTVKVARLSPGDMFYGLIPSGQNISAGAFLQSNGDGKLKAAGATTATANVAKFRSEDTTGAVTADTRLRVTVIQ